MGGADRAGASQTPTAVWRGEPSGVEGREEEEAVMFW